METYEQGTTRVTVPTLVVAHGPAVVERYLAGSRTERAQLAGELQAAETARLLAIRATLREAEAAGAPIDRVNAHVAFVPAASDDGFTEGPIRTTPPAPAPPTTAPVADED